MTNDTDSFVSEVDESLRQDRVMGFFRKWGLHILAGFGVIIIGVVIWQGWRGYSTEQSRNSAEAYSAAQALAQEGNLAEAKAAFDPLREEGPRAYRAMARMEYAALLEAEGDLQGALAEFDAAAEQSPDEVMRLSAQIRAAYIAADTGDFPSLQTRLTPIIESETRFSYLARELLGIEAWEAGELDLARDTLESLTLAFDAPEEVRQRAQIALSVIGPAPATSADGAEAPAPSEGENQ